MGEKPVTDLAGVGDILGKRLTEAGFDKVSRTLNPMFCVVMCVCIQFRSEAAANWCLGLFRVMTRNKLNAHQHRTKQTRTLLSVYDSLHIQTFYNAYYGTCVFCTICTTGIHGARPVSDHQERLGIVSRMDEGHLPSEQQTSGRLLSVPERLVRGVLVNTFASSQPER